MAGGLSRRAFLASAAGAAASPAPGRLVNLVLILTDNHGPWTLGCYGNRDVRTPHIDRLAGEGMRFTRAFAVNAVCSPTRASLLTGLMPSQHGVHRYLGAGGAQIGPGAYNTIGEFATLPGILAESGYTCGLAGKWHLGGNLHPQSGFSYWVTKPHGHSLGFYDQEIIENGRIRKEPAYLTDFWTDHAVRFIRSNRDRPFFLFLAYNGPYGLGASMKEPIRNRHAAYYADKELPSFPRDAAHPWAHNYRNEWLRDPWVRRKYAAEIGGIDDGVGTVMDTLEREGLGENTLLMFTADQGLAGGQSGFWGMGDHTRPLTAFDWTMSVPLLARHHGAIAPGGTSDLMVDTCDLLPTMLDHLGLAGRIPSRPPLPGRSFAPVLAGRPLEWDNTTYFEFENVRAIRTPEWKYIERTRQRPNELYHVANDAGERLNLSGEERVAEVERGLRERLHAFYDRYADPRWDLWKGGGSKSGLLTAELFGIKETGEGRRQ